jgi:hypothetical protein
MAIASLFETLASTRKFILLGDTSNGEAIRDYADISRQYADSVACVYIRNTTATDPTFDTAHGMPSDQSLVDIFAGVEAGKVVFFANASELIAPGVDVKGGNCGARVGGLVGIESVGSSARKLWTV